MNLDDIVIWVVVCQTHRSYVLRLRTRFLYTIQILRHLDIFLILMRIQWNRNFKHVLLGKHTLSSGHITDARIAQQGRSNRHTQVYLRLGLVCTAALARTPRPRALLQAARVCHRSARCRTWINTILVLGGGGTCVITSRWGRSIFQVLLFLHGCPMTRLQKRIVEVCVLFTEIACRIFIMNLEDIVIWVVVCKTHRSYVLRLRTRFLYTIQILRHLDIFLILMRIQWNRNIKHVLLGKHILLCGRIRDARIAQ